MSGRAERPIKRFYTDRRLKFFVAATIIALILKILAGVPLIDSALVVSGLIFIGHLVTFDDDLPGGWSNPFGTEKAPYAALTIKAVIFFAVLMLKLSVFAN